ncbi:MAG: sel1 repeat family protein [Gammaproteobacteria bacterium]
MAAHQTFRISGIRLLAPALGAVVILAVTALGIWHDKAQFELGYAYYSGNFHGWTVGFAQNHTKAAQWLQKAAERGHPRAQHTLGILYAHGWGVTKNEAQSVQWFTLAAQRGYGPSMYHLGWMYHKGDGVPQNYTRSMRLMRDAAEQGMAAAHYALGSFFEHGNGVAPDPVVALKWYTLAAYFSNNLPKPFDNAAVAIRATAAHDGLIARMNPPQVAQGQRLVGEWLTARKPGLGLHVKSGQ